ncbi:MAG: thioredoxin family protein [Magnetospirillum sp. WYHS-4]
MAGRWGVLLAALLWAGPAAAAELVMFESAGCPWCKKWEQEIGKGYDKSEEARSLPLRRVRMEEPRPPDLMNLGRVVFSPTFVVVERGTEIGRIQGYPGEENFWWMLGNLRNRLERMQRTGFPPAPPPPPPPVAGVGMIGMGGDGMIGMSGLAAGPGMAGMWGTGPALQHNPNLAPAP